MTNGERGMHLPRRPLADSERERPWRGRGASGARPPARGAPWAAVSGGVLVLYVLTCSLPNVTLLRQPVLAPVGIGLFAWVRRDFLRDARGIDASAAFLESALARDEADEINVNALAYAEFEEVEDEGACGRSTSGTRVLFLRGQEYYRDEEFPCLEFSVVHALADGSGGVGALAWHTMKSALEGGTTAKSE